MSSIANIPNVPQNSPNPEIGIMMLKKAQDNAKDQGNALIESLPKTSPPGVGKSVDVMA
jgi:hypothetical protein